MRKSSIFRMGMATTLLFLAISCTSQDGVDDEESLEAAEQSVDNFGDGTEAVAEGAEGAEGAGGAESADGGDKAVAQGAEAAGGAAGAEEDLLGGDAKQGDDLAATSVDTGAAPVDVNESLLPESSTTPANPGATASTDAGVEDLLAGTDAGLSDPALGASNPAPPSDGAGTLAAGDTSGSGAGDAGAAFSGMTETTPTAPTGGANWEPPTGGAFAATTEKKTHAAYGGARVPKVATQPIQRGSALLNRYYFARSGDNAEKVSELIYGDASRAKDLSKWNRGKWKPGKLLYYSSPSQPDDAQMISLYEERGLTPETYKVAKGDWISRIASKRLGSPESWKEIAVVNGLSSADAIARGQDLKIYSDLGSATSVATTEAPKEPVVAQNAQPTIPPVEAPVPPPTVQAPPTPSLNGGLNSPPTATMPDPLAPNAMNDTSRKRNRSPGLDLNKILQQNAFFIVVGLVISALLIALLAANKRRRGRDDFDEGFAAVRKRK